MAEPKKSSPKPIADVAEPGTSAPATTSKPVIVTNRPILKDPMMVDEKTQKSDSDNDTVSTKAELSTPGAPPLNAAKAETTEETEAAPTDTQAIDEAPAKKPIPATTDSDDPKADDSSKAESEITSEDSPTAATPENLEAEAAAQAEHEAAIQKLVDSKQYVLPINAVEQRRTKRFVALGIILSLVLAVAWVDIALDAGLIQLGGVKAVTHFFST